MTRECLWSGSLPKVGETLLCAGCQLSRTYGDVRRCQLNGRKPERAIVARAPTEIINSGIGDRLEAAFGKWHIHAQAGCGCGDLQARLNMLTAEQVLAWTELPSLILANAQHLSGPVGLIVKALAVLAPGFARRRITAAIQAAATRTAEDEVPALLPSQSSSRSDNAPA